MILGNSQPDRFRSIQLVSGSRLLVLTLLFYVVPDRSVAADAHQGKLAPIAGIILGPDKKPLEGVSVYLRRRPFSSHRRPFELAETVTKADGCFAFQNIPKPELDNVFPLDVIAVKQGHSIRWKKLRNAEKGFSIPLKKETPFRGILKDDSGSPVGDAVIQVVNMMSLNTMTKIDEQAGRHPTRNGDSFLDISKSTVRIAARTDANGKFTIRGLPHRIGMVLHVNDRRFQKQRIYAATTNEDLPKIPAGKWIPQKAPVQVAEMLRPQRRVALVPIHNNRSTISVTRGVVLKLTLVDDSTGEPVDDMEVLHDQTRETLVSKNGSCTFFRGPQTRVHMVNCYPPASTGLLAIQKLIDIPPGQLEVEHEIRLRPGAIVSGKVIDRDSKNGLVDAAVSFYFNQSTKRPKVHPIIPYAKTDAAGQFRAVVPEASGKVVLTMVPNGYIPPPTKSPDLVTDDPEFSIDVNTSVDNPKTDIIFKVQKRPPISIQIVDADGKPIPSKANIRIYDASNSYSASTKLSDENGAFDITKSIPATRTPRRMHMMIRSQDRRMAAFFRANDFSQLQSSQPIRVVLRPLARVRGQIIDKETKKTLAGAVVRLSVLYTNRSGQGVATFRSDANGGFEFSELIPGMHYALGADTQGYLAHNSIHTRFRAEPGKQHSVDIALVPHKVLVKAKPLRAVSAPDTTGLDADAAFDLLQEEFIVANRDYQQMLQQEKSDAVRERLVAMREPTPVFAKAFMNLAKTNQGADVEFRSLLWLCDARLIAGTAERYRHLKKEAAERIMDRYSQRKEIASSVASIIYATAASYDTALQLMESPHEEVRGFATLIAGKIVAQRYRNPYRGRSQKLRLTALEHFQTVIDNYAKIPYWHHGTLGRCAEVYMFDLKHLEFGAMAPEMKGVDLDGRNMKLSDFRGKVVVIHYWEGNLNDFDRLMELEEQYKDRPLEILGVNTDNHADIAKQLADKHKIPFRHWHDPGKKIFSLWSGSWPNTHVIDHDGKIVYKGQRNTSKSLEDVVDEAIKNVVLSSKKP